MILVVTAVPAERDAIAVALGPRSPQPRSGGIDAEVELGPFRARRRTTGAGTCDVVAVGAGPVAGAAGTAACLGARPYGLVVSAGTAGLYPPAEVDRGDAADRGDGTDRGPGPGPMSRILVADAVVLDSFGAESPGGFLPAPDLGLGDDRWDLTGPGSGAGQDALVVAARTRTGGRSGTIVTVLDATGTDSRAHERRDRWGAVGEAMEGAGVLAAARLAGVPFLEVRGVSNTAGRRDRSSWDIPGALDALGVAFAALLAEPLP